MKSKSVQQLLIQWAYNTDVIAIKAVSDMLLPELRCAVRARFQRYPEELREEILSELKTELIVSCRKSDYYDVPVPRLLAPTSHSNPQLYRKFVINSACISEIRSLSTIQHQQKALIAGVICRTRKDNQSYRDVISAHREGRFNELMVRDNGGRPLVNEAAYKEDPSRRLLHQQYGLMLLKTDKIALRRKVVLCLECDIDGSSLVAPFAKIRNKSEQNIRTSIRHALQTKDRKDRIVVFYDVVNSRSRDAYRTLRKNAIKDATYLFCAAT